MELVDRMILHFLHARTAAGASSLLWLKESSWKMNLGTTLIDLQNIMEFSEDCLPDLVISHI